MSSFHLIFPLFTSFFLLIFFLLIFLFLLPYLFRCLPLHLVHQNFHFVQFFLSQFYPFFFLFTAFLNQCIFILIPNVLRCSLLHLLQYFHLSLTLLSPITIFLYSSILFLSGPVPLHLQEVPLHLLFHCVFIVLRCHLSNFPHSSQLISFLLILFTVLLFHCRHLPLGFFISL